MPPGAAFHQQPRDALLRQRMQHGVEIGPAVRGVVATRITARPEREFMAAALRQKFDVITIARLARGMDQPAGA